MSTLESDLSRLVLPCTLIKPRRAPSSPPSLATRFGGAPYAEKGDSWPICGGCGRGLTFVFQWNLAECPHLSSDELYAFYYCFECNSWGDLPEDVDGAWCLKHFSKPGDARYSRVEDASPKGLRLTPCEAAASLARSLPDWEGLFEYAPEIASRFEAESSQEQPWQAYIDLLPGILGNPTNDRITQIGGYPMWVQSAATPNCERCGARTQLLAQIESEAEADLMWGDLGAVYLFQCQKCKTKPQMQLQCH